MMMDSLIKSYGERNSVEFQLSGATVKLRQTGGSWDQGELIDIALRQGSTRPFLLVSKVLGKHIPSAPSQMTRTHEALAAELDSGLAGPVVFVGMGETATGLGWGVYESWVGRTGRDDCVFLHSTRYIVDGYDYVPFTEEHSHAPYQLICIPREGPLRELLLGACTLVVVDDEVTSGKTMEAMREALLGRGIRFHNQIAVSLISALATDGMGASETLRDWRRITLAEVSVDSVVTGTFPQVGRMSQAVTRLRPSSGAISWGRVGARRSPELPEGVLQMLVTTLTSRREVAVIGSGENMHPAYKLGCALERLGYRVGVQATTRSPVRPGGAIVRSVSCEDPLGSDAGFYLHNPPDETEVSSVILCETGGVSRVRTLCDSLGGIAIEVWDA